MTQLKEIKLIRLNTGEDVIASCIIDEETDSVVLDSPMKVLVSRSAETKQTLMLLTPWLPFELVEEESIYISLENVVTFMSPKSKLIVYYMNMIEIYQKLINDDNEEEDEIEEDDFNEEEPNFLDEEANKIEEYLYSFNKERKFKLH